MILRTLSRNLFSIKGLSALLSSFGALWLCVEIANNFFKSSGMPALIESLWWLFLLVGIVIALRICWPTLRFSEKLKGRDVEIEVCIGDIFKLKGAIVVGSNSTFDTQISRQLISENSIQGQFTRRHYDGEAQLDAELIAVLNGMESENLPGVRVGKRARYPLGTVARVNPKGRTGYFLAIAHINEHGVASGNFEALRESLGKLWLFVGERGLKEPLLVPVLGSGFTRLATPRQEIVQEIIKSFVAACSEKTFCEKMTVVLAESDVIKNDIQLNQLHDYLRYVCTYTDFAVNNGERLGNPVN